MQNVIIEKDQELFNNPGIQRYEARVDCKDGVQRDFLYKPPDLPEFKRRGCRYCGDHGGCHLNEADYKRFCPDWQLRLNQLLKRLL